MHEANNRFNDRQAKRKLARAVAVAEERQLEHDRSVQPDLKAQCKARHPEWFS